MAFGASMTAEWSFTVAIGVLAFADAGATGVGIVAFARMAPAALLTPVASALADRMRRDRVLVWSSLVRGGLTAAAGAVLAGGGPNVVVYALAILATAVFTVFRPAHSALLPALCRTPYELTSVNAVRGLVDAVSTLLGPLAAAVLLDVEGPAAVFIFAGALSLASAALLLRLAYEAPPRVRSQDAGSIVQDVREGFGAVARLPGVRLIICVTLAQTVTRGFLNVFLVVVALDLLGTGDPGVGVLTAAVGAGAVAGSLGVSLLVRGRRLAAATAIGAALWGLPLMLSGVVAEQPAILALLAVIGIGNALVDVGIFTLLPRLVPEHVLGRVFGVLESLIALSVAVGSLVTPLVIDLLGIRGALIALGLVAPVIVAVSWPRLHAIDASVARQDEEIEMLGRVAMLQPLPMASIDELARHVGREEVAAGTDVFRQGDPGDRFYVIEAGEADVIGDGRLIRTMGPGDGFGEIALLHDRPRTTTVRARTGLRLYALERRHFVAAVTGYRSSAREADDMVRDRLDAFEPVTTGRDS
jgi:MFS family permease